MKAGKEGEGWKERTSAIFDCCTSATFDDDGNAGVGVLVLVW
jgi:hypothetical protein